jgi:hypothetical protein
MSSDTHVCARTALQGRIQRVRTCTDRSRVRACCAGAKTMAPMQRAQGRPVTAQYAAQVREAPTAVAARWEHPHRARQRNGADARSESTRDGVRLRVSQGGARHWARWCTGVMPPSSPEPPRPGIAAFPPVAYASPAACVPRASSSRRADAGVSAPQASVRGGEDAGPAAWATRGSTPALCSSSCVLVNPRK